MLGSRPLGSSPLGSQGGYPDLTLSLTAREPITPLNTVAQNTTWYPTAMDRTAPLTLIMRNVVVPASPVGVLIEGGAAASGMGLSFDGAGLLVGAAGEGTSTASTFNSAFVSVDDTDIRGKTVDIYFSMRATAAGRVKLAVFDSATKALIVSGAGETTLGGQFYFGLWSNVGAGGIGRIEGDTRSGINTSAFNGTMTDGVEFWADYLPSDFESTTATVIGHDTASANLTVTWSERTFDLTAQESGSDTATGSVSTSFQFDLATQESNSDTFSGSIWNQIEFSLIVEGSGSDTTAIGIGVGNEFSLSSQETGDDTLSFDLTAPATFDVLVQETGSDSLTGDLNAIPALTLTAQETGADTAALDASVDINADLLVQESGADTATADFDTAVSLDLLVQETGVDTATGSVQHEYEYLRPDGVISAGGWTRNDGSSTDLHLAVDEAVADDADYIRSGNDPVNDVANLALSNISSVVDTNQNIKLKYRYYMSGDENLSLTVRVKEGSTVIASQVHPNVSATVVNGAIELTPAEKAAVANWNNLNVEVEASVA